MAEMAELSGGAVGGGKLKAAVLGATGMVGQQFIRMLRDHPWFEVAVVAASPASAGKPYAEAVGGRWVMEFEVPDRIAQMKVLDVRAADDIAARVDLAFCALNLDKESIREIEHGYAMRGLWVTSNNSAFRRDPFVPMVIPAVNPHHLDVIPHQRAARGYETGAVVVKSNCSIQSYVTLLEPLREFGVERVTVHSEQAVSGAGKTLETWPEMERNVIPLISGEEEKSETEPLKIWGEAGADGIVLSGGPKIKARCVRVGVPDGHTAYVTAEFRNAPTAAQILERWERHARSCELPSAPRRLINYRTEPDRPQPRLDAMAEGGMAITVGQLVVDADDKTISFTALAHNAILGAAGGAVWATEAALSRGLIYRRV